MKTEYSETLVSGKSLVIENQVRTLINGVNVNALSDSNLVALIASERENLKVLKSLGKRINKTPAIIRIREKHNSNIRQLGGFLSENALAEAREEVKEEALNELAEEVLKVCK